MTFLLDVNALIALIDRQHIFHEAALAWFDDVGAKNWATCPITEIGVLRIVSQARYPNSPGSPGAVAAVLKILCALPGHNFWTDDISLFAIDGVSIDLIPSAKHVTDVYLVALARQQGGRLATFDRKMLARPVDDGDRVIFQIPAQASSSMSQ